VLDTLGVAIGALDGIPMVAVRGLLEDLGGTPTTTLIGGGKTSPERAAFYNSGLSRYLDFMDSYLAKGDVALSVAMTSISTLIAPFLTPLLCMWLAGKYMDVDGGSMMLSI
ncbi:hypothetical protein D1122_22335, partial [Cereibacter sphaeroides]|uniref:MmgE/PrpD family protein n=1 Tax=Cereibacter sphaeroides TaxID=1063 RepID=UPI000EEF0FFE